MRIWLSRMWNLRWAVLSGFERFPVAIVALAAFAIYVNLGIAELFAITGPGVARVSASLGGAAAIAASAVLFGEARGISRLFRHAASLVLAVAIGLPLWFWEPLGVAVPALLLALLLAVPLAPYLRPSPSGFWGFVWHLINAGALAFLAVIVFCAGLSLILASLEYLFGVDFDGSVYGHVWSTGLGFVGPIFALSLIPPSFPDQDLPDRRDLIVTGIRILSDFVAVPLLATYALILHVYAAKILLTGEVPRNQIGWMVVSFALAVLVLRVAVHPFPAFARAPTRLFVRYWSFGMIVPLGLLALAIWQRIAAFGPTPERYVIALFAFYLALVIAAQSHAKLRGDIRVIPALGAICLFLASFGPWGMISASAAAQSERLYARLAEAGLIENGRFTGPPDLEFDAAQDVQSIVRMLDEIRQLNRLRPLFAGQENDPFAAGDADPGLRETIAQRVQERLGVARLPYPEVTDGSFSIDPGEPAALQLGGYETIVPWLLLDAAPAVSRLSLNGVDLTISASRDGFVFEAPGISAAISGETLSAAIAAELDRRAAEPDLSAAPFFIHLQADGRNVGLLADHLSGSATGEDIDPLSGRVMLFLDSAEWRPPD